MKSKRKIINLSYVLCVLCLFLSSCEKSSEIEPVKLDVKTAEVSIEVLTEYFSMITYAPQSIIKYDVKSEMFSIKGVDQVSRKSLTQYYKNYKNSNEKSF